MTGQRERALELVPGLLGLYRAVWIWRDPPWQPPPSVLDTIVAKASTPKEPAADV